MSKKKRKKTPEAETPGITASVEGGELSETGKKTIAAGILVVAAGFFVLTSADPMGRNWAASLSPFLILGGYAVIGWGIFRDDPPPLRSPDPLSGPEKTI